MVTRCPTHQVTTAVSDSMNPSPFFPDYLKRRANSWATLGFSAINKDLPMDLLSRDRKTQLGQ